MFRNHTAVGLCFALALFMAGLSGAQAATVVIDPFDDGAQLATGLGSTVDTATGIGGKRFMRALGETSGGVIPGGLGSQFGGLSGDVPGTVSTVWNGGGTLGGVDLTDGGANSAFKIDIVSFEVGGGGDGKLNLFITDSDNLGRQFEADFTDLSVGSNLIAFADLTGQGDLASVDKIELKYEFATRNAIVIDSISTVVPVPAAVWLFGSALGLLGWMKRRAA